MKTFLNTGAHDYSVLETALHQPEQFFSDPRHRKYVPFCFLSYRADAAHSLFGFSGTDKTVVVGSNHHTSLGRVDVILLETGDLFIREDTVYTRASDEDIVVYGSLGDAVMRSYLSDLCELGCQVRGYRKTHKRSDDCV